MLLKEKVLSRTIKKKNPSFISATSAELRRRQQVTGSQAKHATLNFSPSLSREREEI